MKYLSNYTEAKQTELFQKCGAFFAYSNQQFDEAKAEGVDYCSLGSGMVVPKEHAKDLFEGLEKINEQGVAADIAENGINAIIERELFNHECFYVNDITDCLEKLVDYNVTHEQVMTQFNHIRKTRSDEVD